MPVSTPPSDRLAGAVGGVITRPSGGARSSTGVMLIAGPSRGLLAAIVLVVLLRMASVPLTGAGLFVDEAQYWVWSTDLQWGYHSKPPGIAALIALSTALAGDSVLGIRALAMACYGGTAWCLAWLASRAGGHQAGAWAAALFLATPLAGALGLAATTDALLLLAWSTALLALWCAVDRDRQARPSVVAWLAFGVALGLGTLSKYTMLALVPGALAWTAWVGGRSALWRALGAGVVALLVFAPHLVWNATHGWPTLGHTVQTTIEAGGRPGSGAAERVGSLLLAQLLMFGPVSVALAVAAWRGRRMAPLGGTAASTPASGSVDAGAARRLNRLLLLAGVPLLLAGLAQAGHGRIEINWVAPLQVLACAALGLALARHRQTAGRGWALALGAQALLVAALTLLPAGWQALHARQAAAVGATAPGWDALPPRALDAWARMRGWTPALDALRDEVARHPGTVIVVNNRNTIAHASYVWRDLHPRLSAFDADGVPDHHWERECPWTRALTPGDAALLLSEGPLPAPMREAFDEVGPVRQVEAAAGRGRPVSLEMAMARGFRLAHQGPPCR